MKQQQVLLNISELLSRFKFQVAILNASSLFDINVISENFLIPILNVTFNLNLKNANSIKKNFPAIDLIDSLKETCFQITSNGKSDKVNRTIEKFITHEIYEDCKDLYILVLSDKLPNYDEKKHIDKVGDKFKFSKDNILNVEGLYNKITNLEFDKILQIQKYLKSQYTDFETTNELLGDNLVAISKIINNQNQSYLQLKLENYSNLRNQWVEKHFFLEQSLVTIYDLNQIYSTKNSVKECLQKISAIDLEILQIITLINERDAN